MTDELYHHGILGQKWGIRRYQNPDGSLTPEGKLRYGVHSILPKKWGYRSIGGYEEAINLRPPTSYTSSRTANDNQQIKEIQVWEDRERRHIFRGKQIVHNLGIFKYKLSRIFDDVDAKKNLPLLKRPDTPDEALANTNISKGTHLASGNNCCLCTIAYDLRRRGFDVISKQNAPINLLWDISEEDVSWIYGFPKETKCRSALDMQRQLNKQPNGARGAAFCSWNEGTGGHVVAYEVRNGRAKLYDAQSGKKYDHVNDLFSDDETHDLSYIRLDNLEPNYNFAKIAVE